MLNNHHHHHHCRHRHLSEVGKMNTPWCRRYQQKIENGQKAPHGCNADHGRHRAKLREHRARGDCETSLGISKQRSKPEEEPRLRATTHLFTWNATISVLVLSSLPHLLNSIPQNGIGRNVSEIRRYQMVFLSCCALVPLPGCLIVLRFGICSVVPLRWI